LRNQVQHKKRHAVKLGHDWLTTRAWLHEYLMSRLEHGGPRKPLPPDYATPAGMDPIVPVPARRPAFSRRGYVPRGEEG
jgi:hypothetical protein